MKMLAMIFASVLLLAVVPAGANLNLASSLIATGGGAGSYSTIRAFDSMVGLDTVLTNQNMLAADNFARMADQFFTNIGQTVGVNVQ